MDFMKCSKYNKEKAKGAWLMGIAELTAKIESLSEDDYNMVIMLVNRLSEKNELNGLQRFSEDELVEQLTTSMKRSDNGETKSASEVSMQMREKYAV
jgi:hypothetical protein